MWKLCCYSLSSKALESMLTRAKMEQNHTHFVWRHSLVVDTWLSDQDVPGLSPGCARSGFSPWERLCTCISSPHSCLKRVPDYRQYARVMRHL